MVEDLADHFLGNVVVDQPGAEGVPELVRGHVDGCAAFVADAAVGDPLLQRRGDDRSADDMCAVGVVSCAGEQDRACRVVVADVCDLNVDGGGQLIRDRYQCFAIHLVVVVAQIRSRLVIADETVLRQMQGIVNAQSGLHQ
uniref:Aldehyde dehydrogenase n=1 Tax=Rhodococcus sp. B2 TaxID=1185468 RepID=A0A8A6W5Y2_9NOCA|nr:aldehyde dehydrogenase [Rhodococcus sp. B2]